MEKYPVAGEIIGWDLWYGLTGREVGETLAVPFFAFVIPRALGFESVFGNLITVCGFIIGISALILKHDHQTPSQYLGSVINYYIGPKKYHNRVDRDSSFGTIEDNYITEVSDESLTAVQQNIWEQSGTSEGITNVEGDMTTAADPISGGEGVFNGEQ